MTCHIGSLYNYWNSSDESQVPSKKIFKYGTLIHIQNICSVTDLENMITYLHYVHSFGCVVLCDVVIFDSLIFVIIRTLIHGKTVAERYHINIIAILQNG